MELDKALEVITQSPENLKADSDSNISYPDAILLSEILLAKGRFSVDKTFSTRALKHLLATQAFLPPLADPNTSLSFQLLLIEVYTQLNKVDKVHQILNNVLKISRKEGQLIGEIHALNGLGKLAFAQRNISEALSLANQSLELLIQHTDEDHFFVLAENYELLSVIYSEKSDFGQAKKLCRTTFGNLPRAQVKRVRN